MALTFQLDLKYHHGSIVYINKRGKVARKNKKKMTAADRAHLEVLVKEEQVEAEVRGQNEWQGGRSL